jgi:cytochrome d ubiquinol oxidase subunit II
MTTLYVPIALAALGIVLRGSGFAFRKSIEGLSGRRAAGATFAVSSLLTPFFMGAVVGAVAAGNVPANGNGAAFSSWLQPLPLFTGAMFAASGAYLAAVFLIGDARRADDEELEGYFARRALAAAAFAGVAAVFGLIELHAEARYIFDRLTDQGLPLVILSGLCGLGVLASLLAIVRGRSSVQSRYLRPLAAGAVVAVIWGWGVSQFPYLLPTSLKITQAAAPPDTLATVIVVFIVAAILVLPALGLLYWLSLKELLGE